MREIKCRGKRIDNGAWVEGYYCKHIKRRLCPVGDKLKEDDVEHIIFFDDFADWNMPQKLRGADVLPETVGQYTGMNDKNGTEIYEGDIIKTKKYGKIIGHSNVADYDTFKIVYELAVFRLENMHRGFNLVGNNNDFEVIGNIHDNPELPEVQI